MRGNRFFQERRHAWAIFAQWKNRNGADPAERPQDLSIREFPLWGL